MTEGLLQMTQIKGLAGMKQERVVLKARNTNTCKEGLRGDGLALLHLLQRLWHFPSMHELAQPLTHSVITHSYVLHDCLLMFPQFVPASIFSLTG